jgi:hypothetical protein
MYLTLAKLITHREIRIAASDQIKENQLAPLLALVHYTLWMA